MKQEKKLLIESTDFVSKVTLSKDLKESVKLSDGRAGTLIVKNIPATILNRINQNGRIYSTEVMEEALKEAKGRLASKQMLSAGNEHPESSYVAPTEASHVVINAYIKKNVSVVVEGKREKHDILFMDWEVLNTANGKNLRALFEAECSFGTSIRSLGSMNGKYVEELSLLGCDCVGNPSSSTYTRMPISESVVVEFKEQDALNETFTVSTSSTNVVRDLEAAAEVQNRINEIGYGTVTKTSTKVDEEVNPKTGATTSITTLEAETQDDVETLDQALMMAKRAMLNGVSQIDSITIDNIKEDEVDESTTAALGPAVSYVAEKPESKQTTLNEEEKMSLNEFLSHCTAHGGNWVAMLLSGIKEVNPEYFATIPADKDIDINEVFKMMQDIGVDMNLKDDVLTQESLEEALQSYQNSLNEAKEKEADPKEGKKFVLKCPAGFVAMDGNALVFIKDPKEALHFIVGKEESGLVHLSGVEKILDTMGVYDVEKYYRKTPMDNKEKVDTPKEECRQAPAALQEEDGSNTKFSALVIMGDETNRSTETIPISATELDSVLSEVGNLWNMKSQKAEDGVRIEVTDTVSKQTYAYNPAQNSLDPITPNREATGDVKVDNDKVSIEVDDGFEVEKEFDNEKVADLVGKGIQSNKIPAEILLKEDPLHEKLFTKPSSPSDDLVEQPLEDAVDEDEQVSTDEVPEVNLVLSNIDWDIDSVINLLSDEDVETTEAMVSKIENLPDSIDITLTQNDIEQSKDLEDIKSLALDLANAGSSLIIRDANLSGK